MPRYVRSRVVLSSVSLAAGEWEVFDRISMTVHCPEPVDTGLLFPDGEPVMRVSDPIGFTTLKEE